MKLPNNRRPVLGLLLWPYLLCLLLLKNDPCSQGVSFRCGKGPPQKKSDTPVVGGWVRGQKGNMVKYLFWFSFYGGF
jgi:hypothetical protein